MGQGGGFQEFYSQYFISSGVNSDGRCIFKFFARETNMKKKHSVILLCSVQLLDIQTLQSNKAG